MDWETIHKDTAPVVPPRLTDYEEARAAFTWDRARGAPAGLPGGGLNIAHEAVDRRAVSERADKVALRCIARDDAVTDANVPACVSTARTRHSSPRCPAVPTSSSPTPRERCRRRPGATG
ncbi:hypothetical protein ACWEV9_32210 [Streptomyces albogriseolus]|uniref:hypothetical protein n=1 Tax=Streptomyces albogriseolus TaxID=1887 RepID=UPI003460E3F6